ncbi:beta-lactamase family protein [Candidatus Poribacteria bacterium]|nr:beta-lactamase family protein [Candidatus Poribacteria bacterium]MYA55923.1 beta-lactamase family protein [Candidatus Poribacteria bacterium]
MTRYEGLPRAIPEDVGMSTSRLGRIAPVMQGYVDNGKIPCALTMIAREGKLVHFEKFGMQDIAAAKPVEFDTIFRLYSMTKPITSVAVMMLYEEGHFQLTTPVSEFVPAFKDMKVYTEDGSAIVDADREVTIKHLLTHTAGLIYDSNKDDHPIDQRYEDADLYGGDLANMVSKLGGIPLLHQPGTAWKYGMAIDILGYLVGIVSGMPFETFLKTRIFEPLGMDDTGFSVRVENANRYSKVYEFGEEGELQAIEKVHAATGPLSFFHSGGGGLQSTAPDYLRFCQMVLNDGELDGERLLGRKTAELIRMNHVPPDWLAPDRTGVGFGLGFSVVTDVAETHTLGSVGTCSWGGMASTTFWIDPVEDLIGIFMTQLVGADSPFHAQFRVLTYQALTD